MLADLRDQFDVEPGRFAGLGIDGFERGIGGVGADPQFRALGRVNLRFLCAGPHEEN